MRSIAIINQKGGVGKTTTAVNLGHALARRGNRVTLVDLDPQGHLAACLGLFRLPNKGMDQVLLHGQDIAEQLISSRELIDVVPAGRELGEFEHIDGGIERARVLRQAIGRSVPDTDFMVFDCPPSAGLLVANAVAAVDDVLVPVAGDYVSLTGLTRLMLTIRKLEPLRAGPLGKAIFLSRFIARRRLSSEVMGKLLEHFPTLLLRTSIREAAALAECAGAGRTIFEYKPNSKSAAEFDSLADDFLKHRVMGDEQEQNSDVA